jgi:hypothetical protein
MFKVIKGSRALADGWYKAKVEQIEIVEGQYGEQLLITFHIQNGVDTTRRAYLSPYVGEHNRTKLFLDALAVDISTAENLNPEELLDKELMIQLQTGDTKNGKRVQKVIAYAPCSPTVTQSTQAVKRVFTKVIKEGGK